MKYDSFLGRGRIITRNVITSTSLYAGRKINFHISYLISIFRAPSASTDKWKSFFKIHTVYYRRRRAEGQHDRKEALFSFKTKAFFFSSLLRVANVHRLRTPCPRRGIVKYYTGAGGDIGGVTVSNFSSLFLPRYIARCIASVSEMQIAGRSPMACFRYPPFRAVILIGELLSNSLPWLVHEPRFA